jgi:hypothetical protein
MTSDLPGRRFDARLLVYPFEHSRLNSILGLSLMECTIEFSKVFKVRWQECLSKRSAPQEEKAMATDGFEFDPYSMDVRRTRTRTTRGPSERPPALLVRKANKLGAVALRRHCQRLQRRGRFSSARGNVTDDDPAHGQYARHERPASTTGCADS